MKVPLDLVPMALCGLATIVAVAVILVGSEMLRRAVLFLIARIGSRRPRASGAAEDARAGLGGRAFGANATRAGEDGSDDSDVSALPG